MNDIKEELERWVFNMMRDTLKFDEQYQGWQAEKEQAFQRFREKYPKETVTACIDLLDKGFDVTEREGLFLFWFGVRLGLTMAEGAGSVSRE